MSTFFLELLSRKAPGRASGLASAMGALFALGFFSSGDALDLGTLGDGEGFAFTSGAYDFLLLEAFAVVGFFARSLHWRGCAILAILTCLMLCVL